MISERKVNDNNFSHDKSSLFNRLKMESIKANNR